MIYLFILKLRIGQGNRHAVTFVVEEVHAVETTALLLRLALLLQCFNFLALQEARNDESHPEQVSILF
jgi:hypothetical protein